MVDEIVLNIHPVIFGKGTKITEGIKLNLKLRLFESKKLDDNTVQLRYKVLND